MVTVPSGEIQKKLEDRGLYLADIPVTNGSEAPISLLIGGDYYWKAVSGKVERFEGSFVAIETMFGWCVQGPTPVPTMTLGCSTTAMKVVTSDELEMVSNQLKSFWELDSLGIKEEPASLSKSEEMAVRLFESQVTFKDGRYEVKLPWKPERESLSDNYGVANKRLASLVKKLKANASLCDEYQRAVSDQVREGIAEVVREDDVDSNSEMYYMPHHAVIREDKSTRLRIVFDASSHESDCSSLNNCLLPGPNLNPDLLTVLLKFRRHQIVFTADIEAAFLQIALAKEDRDAVRFLWIDEPLKTNGKQEVKIMRMTRVLFGVTSSPFLLAATIRHHIKGYESIHSDVCQMLNDDLYVDDLITGTDNLDEAMYKSVTAREILKEANMNLRKWKTNSKELQSFWERNEHMQNDIRGQDLTPLKVLGLIWNVETDEFTFELQALLKMLINRKNTKRYVLQTASRIFDPMGLISPFVIRIKCLFQEMWEKGLKWDEDLQGDLHGKWEQWCSELSDLQQVTISRCYLSKKKGIPTLHGFGDASEKAYGAVVYLRCVTDEGIHVGFVASKARVAPLKRLTLPRLELMAALIAARLMNYIKRIIGKDDTEVHLWTDSTITLQWIQASARQWKTFICNRVTEIQTLTDPQTWGYCKGIENPADLLTRGLSARELKENELWWKGPNWLSLPDDQWPIRNLEPLKVEEDKTERRKQVETSTLLTGNLENSPEYLLRIENFSSLTRLYRVTAWIKRFIKNLKSSKNSRGPLTAEELSEAEKYWVGVIQQERFTSELKHMRAKESIPKESKIFDLRPFLDENGLICVGGRLQESKLSFSEKHPWILPSKHRFCELLIQFSHEKVFHSGQMDTMIQLREKFWIVQARRLVKMVIRQCLVCKKFRSEPGSQVMAPLPKDRINEAPPFEVTGIDFAGPLYTREKRGKGKAYVALFTCAVTRAIHLELVSDMTAENCLLALRRFFSRRGLCKVIYSDNAKSFKRVNKDLKEIRKTMQNPKVQDFFGKNGISWKFIVEKAAWWGGFWERMVRSVKTCLKKILGKTSLKFEELTTILTEVEAVLNSRPLTFTYNDINEPTPLTPAHFLTGERLTTLPSQDFKKVIVSAKREELTKRYKYRQNLLQRMWTRWRKEYLQELRSARYSARVRQRGNKDFKIDDVVLVNEDKIPKHMWKLGRITEVFQGRDNNIRSCAVRLSSGVTLKRPVQLLHHLELS